MTIEITFDDLVQLVEAARNNGTSVLLLTHTTDNRRATILVTGEARRKHRARTAAEPKAQEAGAE